VNQAVQLLVVAAKPNLMPCTPSGELLSCLSQLTSIWLLLLFFIFCDRNTHMHLLGKKLNHHGGCS
jgi:hypothetical protein